MDHEPGRAQTLPDLLEQGGDGRRVGCVARDQRDPVVLGEGFQHRLVRVACGHRDPHVLFREQSGAARADTGTATNDQRDL